ncbi:MAG: hypothetical protein AABY76_08105 [Planctomycetota bacterium]
MDAALGTGLALSGIIRMISSRHLMQAPSGLKPNAIKLREKVPPL